MSGEFTGGAAVWLITFAAHSCVLIGVGAVLARVCRRRGSVSGEEAVWRVAVFAALATATIQVLLGESWWPALAHPNSIVNNVAGFSGEQTVPATGNHSPRWPTVLVLVALAVSAFRSILWGVARRRLVRFLRCRRAETGPAKEALDELIATTGGQIMPRLTVHNRLRSPVAFGILRPEIAVPTWALGSEPETLRSMLAHELAHLRSRDPMWRALLDLLEILFPWQMLIRLVRRRMETIAEFRCDSRAAVWTGVEATARSLVLAAGRIGQPAAVQMALAGMSASRHLDQRVDRLLGDVPDWKKASRWLAPGMLVLVGILTPVLPGVSWDRTEEIGSFGVPYASSNRDLTRETGEQEFTDGANEYDSAAQFCNAPNNRGRHEKDSRKEEHHHGRD